MEVAPRDEGVLVVADKRVLVVADKSVELGSEVDQQYLGDQVNEAYGLIVTRQLASACLGSRESRAWFRRENPHPRMS